MFGNINPWRRGGGHVELYVEDNGGEWRYNTYYWNGSDHYAIPNAAGGFDLVNCITGEIIYIANNADTALRLFEFDLP
jgi:hypothetical protein